MKKDLSLLDTLAQLGMNEREAKVYLALLEKKRGIAAELQRISGVPQNKIADTISSLSRKGYFIEKREGKSRIYEIIDPKIALAADFENLKKRQEKALEHRLIFEEIYANNHQRPEQSASIEIIHGNDNNYRKYLELLQEAKQEVLGCTRPPFATKSREMIKKQDEAFFKFLRDGGLFRGIYEVNEESPPIMYKCIFDSNSDGEQFRIVPKLPLKLFVFDRRTLIIGESESLIRGGELVTTIVKQLETVHGYIALFDFFWEQGAEYAKWIIGKEELMQKKLAELEESLG